MFANSPQICTADFTAALISRDIDAAVALLSDDVVFFYSNGTVIRGKDAFAATMTSNWKLIKDYKYETLASTWLCESETAAAVIYSFAWSGVAGDREVSGSGRGTRVFCQSPGGGWLIAHEHLSAGQWGP
jgi:ketosteroid isomerase-like protein